jgi:multidrug resistance efflux pump
VAVCAVLYAWRLPPFTSTIQRTENAYVRGKTTLISAQSSGTITEVAVRDYQQVLSGQIIAKVDNRVYRARLDQAEASLAVAVATVSKNDQARRSSAAQINAKIAALEGAKAQVLKAQADYERADTLVSRGTIAKREQDAATAMLAQGEANVLQAQAAVEVARQDALAVESAQKVLEAQVAVAEAQKVAAEVDLENTLIRAPESGRLGEVTARLGQFVTSGTQVVSLVPSERWVIANFKEAQTERIEVGQPAEIYVDGLGGERLAGTVEDVAPAAGSEFSVIKPDVGTGNFVKIPQRLGVRIAISERQPLSSRLRPGMSVEAAVDTSVASADAVSASRH